MDLLGTDAHLICPDFHSDNDLAARYYALGRAALACSQSHLLVVSSDETQRPYDFRS